MAPTAEVLSSPAGTEASACAEEEAWDKDAEIARLSHGIAAYRKSESRLNEAMKCLRERAAEAELRTVELETALAEERRLRLALEGAASAQEPLPGVPAGEAGPPDGTGSSRGSMDCGTDPEAQVRELQLLLADRETLLAATRVQLAEREGRLAETADLLTLLAESDARIAESEALLVKRDERIAEAEAQLRALRELAAEQAARIAELEQRAAASGSASPAAAVRCLGSSVAAAPARTPPVAAAAVAGTGGRAASPPLIRTEFVAAAIAEAFKPQPPSPMVHSHALPVRLEASQVVHPASAAAVAAALRSRPPSPLARPEGPVVAQAPPPWQPVPAESHGARAGSPLPPHRVRRGASVGRGAGGGAQETRAPSPVHSGRGSQALPPGPGPFAALQELRAASPMPNSRGSQTLPVGPVPGRAASPLPWHALDTSAGSLREFAPPQNAAGGPVLRSLPSLPPQELSPLRAASSPMLRPQQSCGPPADGIPPPWAARVSWA